MKKSHVPVKNPCATFSASCTSSKGQELDVELKYEVLPFAPLLLQMKTHQYFFLHL